jgi:hypothetical protein
MFTTQPTDIAGKGISCTTLLYSARFTYTRYQTRKILPEEGIAAVKCSGDILKNSTNFEPSNLSTLTLYKRYLTILTSVLKLKNESAKALL